MEEEGVNQQCSHKQISKVFALSYCFLVSLVYVASLYFFVPVKIRGQGRDAPIHIKYRLWIVVGVSIVFTVMYPFVFLKSSSDDNNKMCLLETLKFLGWKWISIDDLKVLLHCIILFSMPLVLERERVFKSLKYYPFYQFLRNIVIAPLTEEVVFRGCMVPPLLSASFTVRQVTFLAPLFFGTAHVHHMMIKLRNGISPINALISTCVQFSYTYVFGAYSSYALTKTGSVISIWISHSFCNWMGLPDVSFMKSRSRYYRYRWFICMGFFSSIVGFSQTFSILFGKEMAIAYQSLTINKINA